MKRLLVLFVALSLSSCMSIPWNPFSDDGGIEVDAQIGKTNESTTGVKADEFIVGSKETTIAETVIEDTKIGTITATEVSIDEAVPFWIWLIAILGWLLPSPREIWKGLGNLILNTKKFIK